LGFSAITAFINQSFWRLHASTPCLGRCLGLILHLLLPLLLRSGLSLLQRFTDIFGRFVGFTVGIDRFLCFAFFRDSCLILYLTRVGKGKVRNTFFLIVGYITAVFFTFTIFEITDK